MKFSPLLLFLLVLASCTIEDRIENREDRLIGSWVIDRAWFQGDRAVFADNVIDEFRNDQITFYADYSLYYETGSGQPYTGNWAINALRGQDDETFTIDADFFGLDDSDSFRWLGTIDRLTNNNFNVTLSERNGELRLRWDKF